MAIALNIDNRFLSGLFTVINNSNSNEYDRVDRELLSGIRRILFHHLSVQNWAKGQFDESKINRDKQTGQFLPKTISVRQKEFLHYIALGYSNSEIANELIVSTNTSKKHVSDMLDKLSSNIRTDLVVKALKNNLLDLNELDIHNHILHRYGLDLDKKIKTMQYLFEKSSDLDKKRKLYKALNIIISSRDELIQYKAKEIKDAQEKLKNGWNPFKNSPKMKKILTYVAAGYNNKEIGSITNTTESNVKQQLFKLYPLLQVDDRTAAVIVALKYNLITYKEIDQCRFETKK